MLPFLQPQTFQAVCTQLCSRMAGQYPTLSVAAHPQMPTQCSSYTPCRVTGRTMVCLMSLLNARQTKSTGLSVHWSIVQQLSVVLVLVLVFLRIGARFEAKQAPAI